MAQQRTDIVHRVVDSLDSAATSAAAVRDYFEADRSAVIAAARETLDATRELDDGTAVEQIVDRELIEGLRFPHPERTGLFTTFYIYRGRAALVASLVLAAAAALLL